MKPQRDAFSLWHEVSVRFKDIDVGGHAHHSVVLVYFEEGRARYWDRVVGVTSVEEMDFIMAEARVRFHDRIFYPGRLRVGVRVASLSRKTFVLEYLLEDTEGRALASGQTTMVMYDYQARRSRPMPPEKESAIRAFEGDSLL